jgi:hypothetical protein
MARRWEGDRFTRSPSSRQREKFSASRKNVPDPAPHSNQRVYDLALIHAQEGHILCGRKPAVRGFSSRNQQAPRARDLLAAVLAGATSSVRNAGMTYSGCWPNFTSRGTSCVWPHGAETKTVKSSILDICGAHCLFTEGSEGITHQFFVCERAVDFRGIEECDAAFDCRSNQHSDRSIASDQPISRYLSAIAKSSPFLVCEAFGQDEQDFLAAESWVKSSHRDRNFLCLNHFRKPCNHPNFRYQPPRGPSRTRGSPKACVHGGWFPWGP